MPFSQSTAEHTEAYWNALFENLIKPLIEENSGIDVFRSAPRREDVLGEIIKNLVTQHIVVADLTDHNPNVFWELGVRQSFQHRTITIAEHGTKLPFDLGKKGTLFYHTKDAVKNEQFRHDLRTAIQDCIDHPDRPDSYVLEAIAGRGSLFEIIRREEVQRRIHALKSELDFNLYLLELVTNRVKNNIEIQSKKIKGETATNKKVTVTARFRYPSIELLVATRYLDASDDLYSNAESYYDDLHRLNDQMLVWETCTEETDSYIAKTSDSYLRVFQSFAKDLKPYLK
jgi:hypothetical protein